jgi:hypothetical protein
MGSLSKEKPFQFYIKDENFSVFFLFGDISFCLCAGILGNSDFYRLNDSQFKVVSFFNYSSGSCFSLQDRRERIHSDTLYLELVFETRFGMTPNGCGRLDTLERTLSVPVNYINVSTGIVTFDSLDNSLADTIWGMHDSTFNAIAGLPDPEIGELQLSCFQNKLSIMGSQSVSAIALIDLNGKQLLFSEGNILDVALLESGVYLLRIVAASGAERTVRWHRE